MAGRHVEIFAIVAMLILSGLTQIRVAKAQSAPNPITREGWLVHWEISADDGLEIYNVTYKGMPVLNDGRLMGVLVYYVHQVCAFYDEIGSNPPAFSNSTLGADDIAVFSRAGGGFNLTAFANVPDYTYSQYWVFLPDGTFMALFRISGGGCYDIHVYHPIWRLDFPRFGALGNSVFAYSKKGWAPIQTESTSNDSGYRDAQHDFTQWRIGNGTFNYYMVPYDFPSGQESAAKLFVLAAHTGQLDNSHDPLVVNPGVYENGERVFRAHVAVWYVSSHVQNVFRNNVLEPPVTTGLVFYQGTS